MPICFNIVWKTKNQGSIRLQESGTSYGPAVAISRWNYGGLTTARLERRTGERKGDGRFKYAKLALQIRTSTVVFI